MDTDSKVYRFERWALCQRKTGRANFLSDEGPTLETLDFAIRIGSTPTFLYFGYIYIYIYIGVLTMTIKGKL